MNNVNDQVLIDLLKIEIKMQKISGVLSELVALIHYNDYETPEPTDVIFDALGIPPDNSAENDPDDPEYFCRDYFINLVFEGVNQNKSPEEILAELKQARDEL